MTQDNYQDFFTKTAKCCDDIIQRHKKDLGFNPFVLMSDIYKRENFHSDILKAILDPNGSHNEGNIFLHLFYDFIIKLAVHKKQNKIIKNITSIYYDNNYVEVTRETGRTDIALECRPNKWVMIIENKLNNAIDQPRQLPKYYDYWKKRGDCIIAILYLTPTDAKSYPEEIEWKTGDKNMIDSIFLHISGYNSAGNCLYNWLKECELQAKMFNNKSVFEQYSELIKNQAGGIYMDRNKYNNILDSAKSTKMDLGKLLKVINNLPNFYANEIKDRLEKNYSSLNVKAVKVKDFVFVTVIDNILLKTKEGGIKYWFDIYCNDFVGYGLMLGVREKPSVLTDYEAINLVKDFIEENNFENKAHPIYTNYSYYFKPIIFSENKKNNYPTSDELDKIVDIVYSQYEKFIGHIAKIQEE